MSLEESKQMDNTNEQLINNGEYGQNESNMNESLRSSSIISKNQTLREDDKKFISIAAEPLPDINVTGSIQNRQQSSPAVDLSKSGFV
jgi:hypothetical protein